MAVLGLRLLVTAEQPTTVDYLRYNADLVVMATIILIAGGLLTAITFGLFD
jgi:hypothetical protein